MEAPPITITTGEGRSAWRRERTEPGRENALTVINSSVDRIQIESLPANRVIVASVELLLHPSLSLHLENPLVLNKCFTLADLLGIFICGVAAATARRCYPSLPPTPSPSSPRAALLAPAQPYVQEVLSPDPASQPAAAQQQPRKPTTAAYRCSQDVWDYRFPRVKLFRPRRECFRPGHRWFPP